VLTLSAGTKERAGKGKQAKIEARTPCILLSRDKVAQGWQERTPQLRRCPQQHLPSLLHVPAAAKQR
jgi:hypothetical protein